MNKKLLETVFLIAICGLSGDKWQKKTLFLTIFDLRSLIIFTFSIAAYPVRVRAVLTLKASIITEAEDKLISWYVFLILKDFEAK